ncbi:Ing1, partial [Symbiodinium sp. KB8]
VNLSKLSEASLQAYVEVHGLDVRRDASVAELTSAVAQHFEYVLTVDEDHVLARFVNVAKRGPDDRSRAAATRVSTDPAGRKRRRGGLPEPSDADVGSYSADMYARSIEAEEAQHAAKARAMGQAPAQSSYMYDMQANQHMLAQQRAHWQQTGQAAFAHPHAAMLGSASTGQHSTPQAHPQASPVTSETERDQDNTPYCLCQRPSYGNMIGCDCGDCPFAWFHAPCVNVPEGQDVSGKWYCPECRAEPADHTRCASAKVRKQRKQDRLAGRRQPGGEEFAAFIQQF